MLLNTFQHNGTRLGLSAQLRRYVSGTCVDQQPIPSVWYGIIGSPPNQKFLVPPGLAQVHIDGVPTAPASLSIRGINDRGDCVGFCRLVNGDVRPFVALVGDDAQSFDIQNAKITKNFADYACFGINHQREVVGHYTAMGSAVRVGFRADATAPNPVIPKQVFAWTNQNGGQVKTSARCINTAGHIVGSYTDDTKNNLDIGWLALSPGYATVEVSIKRGVPTVIYGINDNLRIVGSLKMMAFGRRSSSRRTAPRSIPPPFKDISGHVQEGPPSNRLSSRGSRTQRRSQGILIFL